MTTQKVLHWRDNILILYVRGKEEREEICIDTRELAA